MPSPPRDDTHSCSHVYPTLNRSSRRGLGPQARTPTQASLWPDPPLPRQCSPPCERGGHGPSHTSSSELSSTYSSSSRTLATSVLGKGVPAWEGKGRAIMLCQDTDALCLGQIAGPGCPPPPANAEA